MATVTREYLLTCNYVDTRGNMIHEVENPQGLIIVAENGRPIMLVSEVSDDIVTNVFIDVAKEVGEIMDNKFHDEPDSRSSQYEILVEHDSMSSNFVPAWQPFDEDDD